MTFGSLFSGIGGMDLGLERAGMECRWQVEIDPFCNKVLEKHWPGVKRYGDIRECGPQLEWVDVIAGGFPCQDVSRAGDRAGIDGARSGLWSHFHRIIRLLRPEAVIVENVPGLLDGGIGRVLGDLAEIGFNAEWDCIPAADFGAEHIRERLFLLAYPVRSRLSLWRKTGAHSQHAENIVARPGPSKRTSPEGMEHSSASRWSRDVHGIPGRVDRIRALGNAVYPDVAEWIGRRIMEAA